MTTPIAYSLPGAVAATGLSRTTLMRAIAGGELKARKSSTDADGNPTGVWIIPAEALREFIDGLPAA